MENKNSLQIHEGVCRFDSSMTQISFGMDENHEDHLMHGLIARVNLPSVQDEILLCGLCG